MYVRQTGSREVRVGLDLENIKSKYIDIGFLNLLK